VNRVIPGLMSLVILVLSIPSHAQKEKMKLGEVLVLRMLDRKSEGGAVDGFLFQADRGSRKGQYAQIGSRDGNLEYHLLSPEKVETLKRWMSSASITSNASEALPRRSSASSPRRFIPPSAICGQT
jgi:hypothetical protein